jgi:hypothetical protein
MSETCWHLRDMDAGKANILAKAVAKRLRGKKESYPRAISSLGAFYRVRTTVQGMRLHLYVGDDLLTIWVRNFKLPAPFLKLAVAVNEPDPASVLIHLRPVGLSMPAFVNEEVYCETELVRSFCQENRAEIEALELNAEERLSVLSRFMGLRLLTGDVSRLLNAIEQLAKVFHRYQETGRNEPPRT